MDRTKILGSILGSLAALFVLTGCGPRPIYVGSKNFTEQIILGEITAQVLEHRLHQPVMRRLDLGGTMLAQAALVSGQLDVYPEYTGTALTNVLKQPPQADAARTLAIVQNEYENRFHLRWLKPLGFNDSFAMVIRGDDARQRNLHSISDAGRCCPWRLGVGYEFLGRPDGLMSLKATYPGLHLEGSPRTMDLGLLYRALQDKQVDLVAANTTDGLLSKIDVVVLTDDSHAFPPYEASLVVREAALKLHAGMEEALSTLSGHISQDTMRKLNYEVDGNHRAVSEVAAEFLKDAGL